MTFKLITESADQPVIQGTFVLSDELKSHLFLVHFSVLFLVRIE